jgi:hypothetical protein
MLCCRSTTPNTHKRSTRCSAAPVLQHHASLRTIKKKLVRKALDAIKKMADDEIACNDDSSAGESTSPSALAVPLIEMLQDHS